MDTGEQIIFSFPALRHLQRGMNRNHKNHLMSWHYCINSRDLGAAKIVVSRWRDQFSKLSNIPKCSPVAGGVGVSKCELAIFSSLTTQSWIHWLWLLKWNVLPRSLLAIKAFTILLLDFSVVLFVKGLIFGYTVWILRDRYFLCWLLPCVIIEHL